MDKIILLMALLLVSAPVQAQVSESTADWPVWQQVSVGTLAVGALLSTVGVIGASNADSNSESGESNSEGSESGANSPKSQAYIEELQDELLILVNNRRLHNDEGDELTIESLAGTYPVLMGYYKELIATAPHLIAEINRVVEGETILDRLNTVMMAHLFGSGAPGLDN